MTRVGMLSAAVGLALMVNAAPAAADTIVYVKGGYTYVANADGSRARAVAPRSPWWAWPSETDAGVIAVAGGARRVGDGFNPSGGDQFFEFDQQGRQLAGPVNTQGSYSTVGDPEYVSHFRVAPDNSYVAWTTLSTAQGSPYTSWRKPDGSGTFRTANDSGGAPLPYSSPEWWGSGHLLIVHDGQTIGTQPEYAVYSLADGSAPGWYDDQAIDGSSSFQVTVARDGRKYAVMTDDAPDNGGSPHNVAITLETTSTPPSDPSPMTDTHCTITLPASRYATLNGTKLASMSFSSDERTLAWAQDDGIYEADVSDPTNCAQVTRSVHRVVPGGAMPFLSPATLAPAHAGQRPRITGLTVRAGRHVAVARFAATGVVGHASFRCKLDRGPWRACRSPLTLRGLPAGRHQLTVRLAGGPGAAQGVRRFKVGA